MKKLSLLFFAYLFTFFAVAQNGILYYQPVPVGFGASKIHKRLLEADMDFWQQLIEESHVNPYHAITKREMNNLKTKILASLPDSISLAQASFAISELAGSLGEGHIGFATDPVSDSLYITQALRFPYLLQDINDGAFIILRDISGSNHSLPPGSRITEINGVAVTELYQKYARLSGGLESWKKLMTMNSIRKMLFMDDIRSPFHIKAVVDNDTISLTTAGYNLRQADSINRALSSSQPVALPFSFRWVDSDIGMIEFNTMNGRMRDSFTNFLERTFEEILRKKPAGLIIDLRKNGGGDSGLGDSLISYISGKSYRNASGMKLRVSKHYKAVTALRKQDVSFEKEKDGYLYEYKVTKLTKPVDRKNRFAGKTCVLIGTGTFSSANMLTNAIKDYQLATLIGEQTAEPANDFGETFAFMLPNTHIVATGAMKMFIRANGDEKDFTGIQPDIYVSNTAHDIASKQDRVLDRAKEWIRKN